MPSILFLEKITDKKYTASTKKSDVAFRVIVDHIRAITFSIADGQLPSNTGAGYVIRRILRRAVRYGYSFLDLKSAFLYQMIEPLIKVLGVTFPELKKQQSLIEKVIQEEEQSFLRTLDKGIQLFETYVKEGHKKVAGDFAFELYDTFGFPLDLTALLAQENGLEVDLIGFEKNLQAQKTRSRAAATIDAGDWNIVYKSDKEDFVGYDFTETQVRITRFRRILWKRKEKSIRF